MASAVQVANSTSATSRGSIQCTPLRDTPFGSVTVGSGCAESLEPLVQLDQLRRIEAGADAAGVAQLALRVIIADEQRAKTLAAAFGIGVADHDELLAIAAFDLEPAAASPRPVGLGPPLRDDAFQLEAARLAQERRAAADLVIAVAQHALRLRRNDLGESRLAILERRAGQVPAVAIEQVEGEEVQRVGLAAGNRVLQAGKARRAVGLEMNELAVDQRRIDRQLAEASAPAPEIWRSSRDRRG